METDHNSDHTDKSVHEIGAKRNRISDIVVNHRIAIAAIGVGVVSLVSGLINFHNGWDEAINAGSNQFIFSSISAVTLMRIHDECARNVKKIKSLIGEIIPIIIPISISIGACYAIHKFGIPTVRAASSEPELSTAPTAIFVSLVIPFYHYAHSERLQLAANKLQQQMSEQFRVLYVKFFSKGRDGV